LKRPSFQFYPNDWTSNPNLRRCTFAEKGIWLDVMCLMHDQEPYGILRWPLKEIAEAVKCRPADLSALVRKGVLKGDDKRLSEPFIYVPRSGRKDGEPVELLAVQDGPVWYSSRMVKDEYVRTIRGESTRFGEEQSAAPKVPQKHSPKPPLGDGSSSSSSSSTSPSVKGDTPLKPPAWTPPEWVPAEQWADFVKHRRAMRGVPFTDAARDGVIRELAKFRGMGYDPAQLLETSVVRGWRTVFEPKGEQRHQPAAGTPYQQHRAARMAEAVPGLVGAANPQNIIDTEARDVTAPALG
jgi:hypothetical protein